MAKRARPDEDDDDDDPEPERPAHFQTPEVGLSVLRARDVEIAAILRRGPTKQVRMIRWDMRRDELQRGQWVAARIYAYASRITPDGKYVDYHGIRRGDTWRAIAKPPYFTPLAVWGGINGQPGGWESPTGAPLPAWLTPGWRVENRNDWVAAGEEAAPFRERIPHPAFRELELQRRDATPVMDGYASWTDRHSEVFRIFDLRSETAHDLGTADWADWHPSGDLAIARDGTISRIPIVQRVPGEPRVIADFNGETFEKLPPPKAATIW
jgi:hypothetical protein